MFKQVAKILRCTVPVIPLHFSAGGPGTDTDAGPCPEGACAVRIDSVDGGLAASDFSALADDYAASK